MFSFTDIEIFSQDGIDDLKSFKKTLESLKLVQFEKGSSAYSQKMLEVMIDIVNVLLANNSVNFWKKNENQEMFVQLTNILDNKKGTLVPEVFNEQSLQIAKKLLSFLETIKLDDFLKKLALTAIKTVVSDPANVFRTLCENLKYKIKLYEIFVKNEQENIKKNEVINKMQQHYDVLLKEINGTLTESELVEFKKKYTAFVAVTMLEVNKLDYVRICNASSFVNEEKPRTFSQGDLASTGNRGVVIWNMILWELDINKALDQKFSRKPEEAPKLSDVYHLITDTFKLSKAHAAQQKFLTIIQALLDDSLKYNKGEHITGFFSSFRSVDAEKIALLNSLNKNILLTIAEKLVVEPNGTGRCVFDCFTSTLQALQQNEKICSDKKISLGELSKIVSSVSMKLFMLSFTEIDQSNDDGIIRGIRTYESKLGIKHSMDYQTVERNHLVAKFLESVRKDVNYVEFLPTALPPLPLVPQKVLAKK